MMKHAPWNTYKGETVTEQATRWLEDLSDQHKNEIEQKGRPTIGYKTLNDVDRYLKKINAGQR